MSVHTRMLRHMMCRFEGKFLESLDHSYSEWAPTPLLFKPSMRIFPQLSGVKKVTSKLIF